MGAFGEHAGDFIDRNIPVIPTSGDDGKRPCIKNWQKLGAAASRVLADSHRFDGMNLAFVAGQPSRLTVLDIDTPDPKALNSALARFGDTPIIIQTGSGKYQAWYRHNGEGRMIRPLEDIDILGAGICVAPPSERPDYGGAKYKWIAGDLDDIDRLPCLENVPVEDAPSSPGHVCEGQRTNDLFRELRAIAFQCDTIEDMQLRAEGINATVYDPPLSNAEIRNQVKGVWRLKQEGRCFAPGTRSAVFPVADIVALAAYPPAMVLEGYLRAHHPASHVFAVSPKGLSSVLRMSHPTIAKARDWLMDRGRLELVEKGRKLRGDNGKVTTTPDQFRLSPG